MVFRTSKIFSKVQNASFFYHHFSLMKWCQSYLTKQMLLHNTKHKTRAVENLQKTCQTLEPCQGPNVPVDFPVEGCGLWRVLQHVHESCLTGSLCVHRGLDHHRWDPHWCDEACRGGCEGLRPEQLPAKADCCNRSCNMGDNSQQGCPGAGGGTVTRVPRGFASRR